MKIVGAALGTVMVLAMGSTSLADTVKGEVVAYDRKAQVLVMEDRSIYSLANYEAPVLSELEAGDMVEIETTGEGEDGYGVVTAVTVMN